MLRWRFLTLSEHEEATGQVDAVGGECEGLGEAAAVRRQ